MLLEIGGEVTVKRMKGWIQSKNNFMKITSAYDMVQGDRDMNNEFKIYMIYFISDLMPCINSVAQSCPTLWDPMNRSTPGLPVHHQLPNLAQTHVHEVCDAIQLKGCC